MASSDIAALSARALLLLVPSACVEPQVESAPSSPAGTEPGAERDDLDAIPRFRLEG